MNSINLHYSLVKKIYLQVEEEQTVKVFQIVESDSTTKFFIRDDRFEDEETYVAILLDAEIIEDNQIEKYKNYTKDEILIILKTILKYFKNCGAEQLKYFCITNRKGQWYSRVSLENLLEAYSGDRNPTNNVTTLYNNIEVECDYNELYLFDLKQQ